MVIVFVKRGEKQNKNGSKVAKFLLRSKRRSNFENSSKHGKILSLNSWFQRTPTIPKKSEVIQTQDDVLPKFNPELRFTSGIYEYSRNAFKNGFPIYEAFYSGKDFNYHFTCSKLNFETIEQIIQLPLRGNFSRYPSKLDTSKNLVDGLVFLNRSTPTKVLGDPDSPISKWYITSIIHRSYNRCTFDAEISVSCEKRCENLKPQVALQLQVLDRFGRVYSSRICRNGFRVVSTENVARFNIPHILNLQVLGNRKNNLIQDSKCQFRIILTSLLGYENDKQCSSHVKDGCLNTFHQLSMGPYDENITMKTMAGVLVAKLSFFTQEMCTYIQEGAINLQNFSSHAVINILRFNLTGKIKPRMQCFELLETLYLAHHFKNQKLKEIYLAEMVANLTPKNAATILVTAFVFQASENLWLQIKQYVIRNMAAILKVKSTTYLAKQFPRAFLEILFGPICGQRGQMNNGCGPLVHKRRTALPLAKFLQQAFHSLANND